MAAPFCLTPEARAEFNKALKDRTLDLAALLDPKMTSEARTELFRPYAGDAAGEVNKLFESKLLLKNRMLGLQNFVSKLGEMGKYSPEGKAALKQAAAEYKARQTERVFSPQEHEAFLNDMADKAIGAHISKEVAAKVFELSSKADELRNVNPKMSGISDEYLQAKNALEAYVAVQKNTSPVASIIRNVAVIGRNNLLLGLSTPTKTTIGQTINAGMEAASRRIAMMSLTGAARDVATKANAEAWQTYVKTGDNTASAESLASIGLNNKLGERLSFRNITTSNAPGALGAADRAIGKYAQLTQKVAIDWEHNITFTKFYQKTFFDSVNIFATKAAQLMGGDAKAIATDAVRIEPLTTEGSIVRQASQQQAMRVTSINPTWLSNIAMSIKAGLNDAIPGLSLGDFLVPMAKIPATVIANAIDNAGPGIPLGIRDIVRGRQMMQSTDMATKLQGMVQQAQGYQRLTRTLGVIGAAAWFSSGLDKKDFRTDKWGNHFVHMAGLWINLQYVSAFSPALAGIMWMRQKMVAGQGVAGAATNYVAGAGTGLLQAPGANELTDLFHSIADAKGTKGIVNYFKEAIASRAVPAFIRNAERPGSIIEHEAFGAHGAETDAEYRQDKMAAAHKAALTREGLSQ